MNDVVFPAIWIWKSGAVWIGNSHEELFQTTRYAHKKRRLEDSIVIDSQLNMYKIDSITDYSGYGIFGGYNIFFERNIVVHPHFSESKKIEMDEFKRLITRSLHRSSMGSSGITSFKSSFENLHSFEEIYNFVYEFLRGQAKK